MEAIGIVVAAVAVIWLIVWTIQNEDVTSIGEQKGLFRMIDHEARKKNLKKSPARGLGGRKST